MRKVQYFWL